ncbi:MAG: anaerobic ribonucleoside-triphosphate reductase activating protein [Herbinix sp.]|nr:anaerobic ribonucleoside-triphosphate reductase activating protein [Herbinix sp.]
MQIHGFNKLTLLDYPGHLAATIFLGSCNMRCPFCQNASLVINPSAQPSIPVSDVLANLQKRTNILEGVCISGGEPTIYPDLPEFIKDIKALGFKVKLDTNGTNPALIKALVKESLLDYIAMDIKNSKDKYALTSGNPIINLDLIDESVAYLLTSPLDYEFRTTIVKELHTKEDILSIGEWIKGAKAYYLQSYQDSGDILAPGLSSHTKETLTHFAMLLAPFVGQVSLRGVD